MMKRRKKQGFEPSSLKWPRIIASFCKVQVTEGEVGTVYIVPASQPKIHAYLQYIRYLPK